MATEFQEGDVGTRIEVQIIDQDENPVDLQDLVDYPSATIKRFIFQRPGGQTFTKEPDVVNPSAPSDGLLEYFTESADLIPAGDPWQVQALIKRTDGQWHSRIKRFRVLANLE